MLETKLPFEVVEIDLSVPRESWYLDINPAGKVPAIKAPNGEIICESAVCTEYIADITKCLLPDDATRRARVRFFAETFIASFLPAYRAAMAENSSDEQYSLLHTGAKIMSRLVEDSLEGGPFLCGSPSYTLAEVNCVPFLARFDMAGRTGLLGASIYNRLRRDSELTAFMDYIDVCLAQASHRQIWDEKINLDSALAKRPKKLKEDYIFLEDLHLIGKVGLSAFSFKDKTFPITISIQVKTEPVKRGSDEYSISYGDVCRDVTRIVEQSSFERLEDLAAAIIKEPRIAGAWRTLVIKKEGGLLRADSEILEIFPDGHALSSAVGIRVGCIIGIYPHERELKQDVLVNLSMRRNQWLDRKDQSLVTPIEVEQYKRTMLDAVTIYLESSTFKTVEAMAQSICELSLGALPRTIDAVSAWISKPSALTFAKQSGVSVTRTRQDLSAIDNN